VNKHVRPTIVGLNKAEAFLAVEPLHNTRRHYPSPIILTISLLPTIHVSNFDPAMSWERPPKGAAIKPFNSSNPFTVPYYGMG
jgi:hypothetical protein